LAQCVTIKTPNLVKIEQLGFRKKSTVTAKGATAKFKRGQPTSGPTSAQKRTVFQKARTRLSRIGAPEARVIAPT
jgi:hypothetical protein